MQSSKIIDLSTPILSYALDTRSGLTLETYGLPELSWAQPSSALFALDVNGQRITAQSANLLVTHVTRNEEQPGRRVLKVTLHHADTNLAIHYYIALYADTALIETWLEVQNIGSQTQRLSRMDSLVLDLPAATYEFLSFSSSWAFEFEPQPTPLSADMIMESRTGRSSNGQHPWFALVRDNQSILSGAVAWSGNWIIRILRQSEGFTLSGGLHDWEFAIDIAPGAQISAPPFVLAVAAGTNLDRISAQYSQVGRDYWYPHTALADSLPVEWNHWWSYADKDIDETVFRDNVDHAATLGIEVCTLDAGWFGASDAKTHWYEQRGDWDLVNAQRFPSGLRALSDYVHERGMAFGLWCEIEAIGKSAHLADTHPEISATRDGEPLGYVCLGSAAGQQWALATLERLISEYHCDWIKLDFNLDPGAGCNRRDHGHGAGDGLYAHYQGYYALLTAIRSRYPHVVLENCSSGGLRIDLGLARHTHMAFLSDPDWPEHSLQCFWGASLILAPAALLHWSYCEWSHAEHRCQAFNPNDPALLSHQIDYYTRISMLHRFGFSQRLPNLPDWVTARYHKHIATYKQYVRRFIQQATLRRLTEQPRRFGAGQRWAAFQYSMPDGSQHLLAVFRLPGAAVEHTIRLIGLEPQRLYTLLWLDDHHGTEQMLGSELQHQGLLFALPEEGSVLLLIQ